MAADSMLGQYRDRKVMITGGAGFIGSNLARRLLDLGARVTVVDSMIPGHGGNLFNLTGIEDKIRINYSDVRDTQSLSYLIRGQDYLFNLAGQVSHTDSMEDPYTDLDINAKSQLAIVETCRRHNPEIMVVFASTRQLYGRPAYLPVDEEHPINPVDVNGVNKRAGEQFHLLYNNVYGIRTTCLRLTNTYGPRQMISSAKQGFIGFFFGLVVQGKPISIFGDGTQVRDFNYVDDAVEALLIAGACPDCRGRVYNLAGERMNLKDLVELMLRLNGSGEYSLVPFPEERKRIDIGDFYGDCSKFTNATGWRPLVGLEEGIGRTLDFFRANHEHYLG